jgi:hypothetical protein
MAKMLALAYPLAVFTLFYPFFAFFNLFSPQPNANPSPKQQKQPKTPISKGGGATIYKKSKHKKRIISADRTC